MKVAVLLMLKPSANGDKTSGFTKNFLNANHPSFKFVQREKKFQRAQCKINFIKKPSVRQGGTSFNLSGLPVSYLLQPIYDNKRTKMKKRNPHLPVSIEMQAN